MALWISRPCLNCLALFVLAALPLAGYCQADGLPTRTTYARKIALLIGTGHYQAGRGKGAFRDLPAVANDLNAMGLALTSIGFQTKIYSDLDVPGDSSLSFRSPLVAGESPVLPVTTLHIARIVEQLLDSLEQSTERTLLVVYLSGHGGILGKSDRVVALPDSEPGSPDSFFRVRKLLNSLAERAPNTDKYLIVDACAGPLGKRSDDLVTRIDEELPPYVFSSRLGESSYIDPEKNQSVFTFYLVQAIVRAKELNLLESDGTLDTDAIRAYLYAKVPLHAKTEQKRRLAAIGAPLVQHPFGSTQNLSLTVIRDTVPSPPPSAGRDEIDRYTRALFESHYPK